MLKFTVPTGLGDISWLYSKLVNLGRPFEMKICENNRLNRASGFLDILPGVVNGGYQDLSYHKEFVVGRKALDPATDIYRLPDGDYFLSANEWLDSGHRIEGFLPTLPVTYHYEMNIPQTHKDRIAGVVKHTRKRPLIAIYTSKYNAPETGWHFWSPKEWAEFCKKICEHVGGCSFIFIGAKFDTTIGQETVDQVSKFTQAINMIGETEVGEAIEIIKNADYLVAFPSGIGILGDVVNTPTMMFLPSPRHDLLKDMYADPENISSGRHLNVTYCKVDQAFEIWKQKGIPHMEVLK